MFKFTEDSFKPNTEQQIKQTMADLYPRGKFSLHANKDESNVSKFLKAFAVEVKKIQDKIYEVSTEYYIPTCTNLLDEWERALGIPDSCFKKEVSIEQRRKQIQAKLALMNVYSAQDFIDLAKFFGFNVKIFSGRERSRFTMIFPFVLGDIKTVTYTIIVQFVDLEKPSNVFPMIFPFIFGDDTNIIKCLFNKLIQANMKIKYIYKD